MMWRRFEAEGTSWEVSASPADADGAEARPDRDRELLEFRSTDRNRPARRLLVNAGQLERMDDQALRHALRKARPIGADFYGRPGKRMSDAP